MAREKLKDFLNKKNKNADTISYVQRDGVDGLGVDPNTSEELLDLLNETSGLLGDYISFLTDEAKNKYKIKPGNSLANTSKRGDRLDIADNQGADETFIVQGTNLAANLNNISNSKYFDNAGTPLNSIIDKTATSTDSHNLYKSINGKALDKHGSTLADPQGEENNIVQSTNKVFLQNNRFANVGSKSNKSFTEKPQSVKDFEKSDKNDNAGTLSIQNKFGEYDKNLNIVTFDQLKDMAKDLLINASGFTKDIQRGSSFVTSDGFKKPNILKTRVQNAESFPQQDGQSARSGRGDLINGDPNSESITSFGSSYNTEFKFLGGGDNQKLHNIEALTSMLTLKNIAQTFFGEFIKNLKVQDSALLISDTEKAVLQKSSIDPGHYMLGRSRHMNSIKLDYHIFSNVLTNTIYPYGDAVERGLEVIFSSPNITSTKSVLNVRASDLIKTKNEKVENKNITQSAGFWMAVSRSILKSYDQIISKYVQEDYSSSDENKLFLIYRDIVESNKFIQFYNTMATIGDISLSSTAGEKTKISEPGVSPSKVNHRNVNNLPDSPAYSAGKSRKKSGRYKTELSWNQDSTQSVYLLPANIIRASIRLNNAYEGTNPARAMLGSSLVDKTYFGIDVDGSGNRIPKEVVKVVEDRLEAEYVPFYLHDLRTNEIISFNAFLTSLSDSITPTFKEVDGYGRMDSVQIYSNTKRSVDLEFILYSTNREDFDSMYYKINKLTTLLYPQWTPGSMVGTDGLTKFYQPFSQAIGASPIVRLRVGDIIKSNYSKFSLARTFGIGDAGVNANPSEAGESNVFGEWGDSLEAGIDQYGTIIQDAALKIWLGAFGSPLSLGNAIFNAIDVAGATNIKKMAKGLARSAAMTALANVLVSGFANPLAVNGIIKQLKDPSQSFDGTPKLRAAVNNVINKTAGIFNIEEGLPVFDSDEGSDQSLLRMMILKPNTNTGYFCHESKKIHYIPRRINVRVVGMSSGDNGLAENEVVYKVRIVDINAPNNLFGKNLLVRHKDILPDPKGLFNSSIMGITLYSMDPIGSSIDALVGMFDDVALSRGIPAEAIDALKIIASSNSKKFMQAEINPFVKAYESTRGRGLAGVLGGITFNWLNDFPWEIDHNARAPIGCKIKLSLKVIHDIPPGLDHTGYNKAPLYNVGEIMKNVAGDPYDDNGKTGEFNYKKAGKHNVKSANISKDK